ncbi:peroxidase P7-like isoform X1 [Canna indica]|uniref:Peroxidase n=1 Tax=Canna indica TaxID=4628 RepID=A0AAQ3JVI9_9LILI|nr:peroxidase P7-like isoform X1 [Canna indica]
MAFFPRSALLLLLLLLALLSVLSFPAHSQLSPTFYDGACPSLQTIVRSVMASAVQKDLRVGAFVLRLFFHDCFVNGCDASVLLDDTPFFTGEKSSSRNRNSLGGFEVIDAIKSQVEAACDATVSCADILALAARDGVVLLGGPSWDVPLGRRDARTASADAATANLPPASSDLPSLIGLFGSKGLSPTDLTALSGAHTIGFARCTNFRDHIYRDGNVDPGFASLRRKTCPAAGGDGNLAPLDVQSPVTFDGKYYENLVARRGLLHSDQELFNGRSQDALVGLYSGNTAAFFGDFAAAMVKMGNISPLTGGMGEIRLNCRRVN